MDLETFVTRGYNRTFELEKQLENAPTYALIAEYEELIAGTTYLDVEDLGVGSPGYEDTVQQFMNRIQQRRDTDNGKPRQLVPYQASNYHRLIRAFIQALEEPTPRAIEEAEMKTDGAIDTLETQVRANPEAVQMLRLLVKVGVFLNLLRDPELDDLLEPHTAEFVEELQEVIQG